MGDAAPLREQITSDMPQISDWNVEGKLLSYQRLRVLRRAGNPAFLSHDVEDFAVLPSGGQYWD